MAALIIFFSKALLRHPLARSNIVDFTEEAHFKWVIQDPEHGNAIRSPEECTRLLICSGQVYAALHKHRAENEIGNVAITRVEQLHPFPYAQLRDTLDQYPNVKEIFWTQEEPLNAGAWSFVQPRMETVLKETNYHGGKNIQYAGRPPSASVATGIKAAHVKEEQDLLNTALGVGAN